MVRYSQTKVIRYRFSARKPHSNLPSHSDERAAKASNQALARLPTSSILRSLLLGSFFSSSFLFISGFALLKKISNSNSKIWNPDKNPILRAIVKPLIFDQFCAGTNRPEIKAKSAQIKALGFSGVMISYGRESQTEQQSLQENTPDLNKARKDQELEWWRRGNLETLDMISEGDYLGIKLTGCGNTITKDLFQGNDPPKSFWNAIDNIVQKATAQNCRIWVDAEQQAVQPTIDRWTIDLMRKYNCGGKAKIYNTVQAYLKTSRQTLESQLQLAHREDWTLGIKLVRGAYIENDIRERIHDTKAETDECYNSIVRDILSGKIKGVPTGKDFPTMQLFIAGHNPHSVSQASALVRALQNQGTLTTLPEFGQLQGMADQLGCELVQHGEDTLARAMMAAANPVAVPRVYKCLTWGSIQECMRFLVRRAVENRGATGAVKDAMPALARKLRRRMVDMLLRRRKSSS
ncbi:MAG: hypothetical protein Q9221_006357 [Calogaya cf. arnoldii]